jgi:threonine aldolase
MPVSHNLVERFARPLEISRELGDLASMAGQSETFIDRDSFGQGRYLGNFEVDVAAMFGKQAGMFCVNDAMAQVRLSGRVHCPTRWG